MPTRLDAEDSRVLLRMFVNINRRLGTDAIRLAESSLKNDRQFKAFQRTIRGKQTEGLTMFVRAAQDFGYLSQEISPDEIAHIR